MAVRDYILNNFWLKVFSVIAGILIWFSVDSIQHETKIPTPTFVSLTRQQFVPVPIEVLTLPGDGRVFKVVPDKVYVTITGEAVFLNELTKREVKAYVDLTDLRTNVDDDRKVILHVPKEITVRAIDPSAVKVQQVSP